MWCAMEEVSPSSAATAWRMRMAMAARRSVVWRSCDRWGVAMPSEARPVAGRRMPPAPVSGDAGGDGTAAESRAPPSMPPSFPADTNATGCAAPPALPTPAAAGAAAELLAMGEAASVMFSGVWAAARRSWRAGAAAAPPALNDDQAVPARRSRAGAWSRADRAGTPGPWSLELASTSTLRLPDSGWKDMSASTSVSTGLPAAGLASWCAGSVVSSRSPSVAGFTLYGAAVPAPPARAARMIRRRAEGAAALAAPPRRLEEVDGPEALPSAKFKAGSQGLPLPASFPGARSFAALVRLAASRRRSLADLDPSVRAETATMAPLVGVQREPFMPLPRPKRGSQHGNQASACSQLKAQHGSGSRSSSMVPPSSSPGLPRPAPPPSPQQHSADASCRVTPVQTSRAARHATLMP
mmetsp:Transcript_3130/g.12904  ORF Transcript_3130/g.12904 Transcript_3130/m.12904 type:complete len:411 (+) Transcript_3130:2146-3378(+)